MLTAPPSWATNRLLNRLPRHDLDRLLPSMQPVTLELKAVLYEPGAPLDYAYFPTQGEVSMVLIMRDGAGIEVATVGNEGMVELSALLIGGEASTRCIVQVPGTALRMPAEALRAETRWDSPLRHLLALYQAAFHKQVSQAVACNGLHPILQRCCRWILMTHDRAESQVFPMTHEFMAQMLGVRRSSVTEVLQPLDKQGLIRNLRGRIEVLDRAGLEAHSCECYRAVRDEFERFLG